MSYLSEAYQFLVPNYYFHTNNGYMVIGDDYQVDTIHAEKINEPRVECSFPNKQCIGNYIRVSPTVTMNNFPQLPNMGAMDDFYRQRGRGRYDRIYMSKNQGCGLCNMVNTCKK